MRALTALLQPWHAITSPLSYGLDNIPRRGPRLFVGNHTLFGMLDAPMLFLELYTKRKIVLRSLGDHVHFRVPLWRDVLTRYGVVDGTRENCAALMAARQSILVFPGGAREVFKRKGEKYKLLWGQRLGFARLAIQYSYPIIPFAAVGADDAWDIVVGGDQIVPPAVQAVLERLGLRTDAFLPIVKGIGPTPLPRPERLYFYFAPPVPTRPYRGLHQDDAACWEVREQVRRAIASGLKFLLKERKTDPGRDLFARLFGEERPRRRQGVRHG
ncbi:MAG TPA: lysophospholipid acyltransferase family protein [Candidatus Margulisiibacteriota bacterium]|nr:lysophospholipid acyltransferase family protein [Candidatus Margulisiibacteriota bacterium]